MNSESVTTEQWRIRNAHRLVACRFGGCLTREACRSYQVRAGRYVRHFTHSGCECVRVSGDYVRCLLPDRCPHALSDEEAAELREHASDHVKASFRRNAPHGGRARDRDRLVNPDYMMNEPIWRRSLVHQVTD